jgi:hypothetical protein
LSCKSLPSGTDEESDFRWNHSFWSHYLLFWISLVRFSVWLSTWLSFIVSCACLPEFVLLFMSIFFRILRPV